MMRLNSCKALSNLRCCKNCAIGTCTNLQILPVSSMQSANTCRLLCKAQCTNAYACKEILDMKN